LGNVLEINDLSIAFSTDDGEVMALQNVSFVIPKGKVVALVGESGSGKSVTSMAIMRLLAKNAIIKTGEINYFENNEPVNILRSNEQALTKYRGNKVSMIFQEPMSALNPLQKCGPQVAEIILQHHIVSKQQAKAQVISLFNKVLLPQPAESYNKYPHQLSGGQKQRVVIAMALANNPSLIICDEPTTALDVTVQQEILLLLKKLQTELNLSYLFISHDLGVVQYLADEIVVMYRGKIVEKNSTHNIIHNPQQAYTQALLACRPKNSEPQTKLLTVDDFINPEKKGKTEIISYKKAIGISPIISLENVCVEYGGKKNLFGKAQPSFKALHNINFTINEGEIVGLVGESGCGKTTTGRAILGLQPITQGNILYQGKPKIYKGQAGKALRKNIQIIFQDPFASLNPKLTIGHAITEGIYLNNNKTKKEATNLAKHWLEQTGLLTAHYNRYPHEFSGGQRQRIVIARALSLNPKFVVCDESVSALDVSVQAQVINLLMELRNNYGFSILFISHDMHVVHHISDTILVMQKGEIVERNTAQELFAQPQNDYTKKLLQAIH
jgi:peptide/nickel transport system ATP-binding protein